MFLPSNNHTEFKCKHAVNQETTTESINVTFWALILSSNQFAQSLHRHEMMASLPLLGPELYPKKGSKPDNAVPVCHSWPGKPVDNATILRYDNAVASSILHCAPPLQNQQQQHLQLFVFCTMKRDNTWYSSCWNGVLLLLVQQQQDAAFPGNLPRMQASFGAEQQITPTVIVIVVIAISSVQLWKEAQAQLVLLSCTRNWNSICFPGTFFLQNLSCRVVLLPSKKGCNFHPSEKCHRQYRYDWLTWTKKKATLSWPSATTYSSFAGGNWVIPARNTHFAEIIVRAQVLEFRTSWRVRA